MADSVAESPAIPVTAVPSDGRRRVRRFLRRMPIAPGLLLALLVLCAVFAPLIAPHSPLKIDLSDVMQPPFWQKGGSLTHPLGTDKVGRDVLSRIVYGGRVSLVLAGSVIAIGGGVGTVLGLISGYVGKIFDAIVQRGTEAVLSLPTIMVALVFVFVLGQSFVGVIIIISPFVAARFARMIRGEAIAIRESDYVGLARVAGASTWRIMFRHILPNVGGTIIVLATLEVGSLILLEASLSFLGVGVPPPTPSWGQMVADGRDNLVTKYWLSLFPGLAIVATVLSINWIGDWLRDTLDPKRKSL